MRENHVRSIWKSGGFVVNGWLHIPSAFGAEVMANEAWDSLTIDLQHGPVDYQTAVGMLQAISTTQATPFARVPWNEPGIIMKMLDAGCYGIICPMINTRAQAEAFAGAVRYPPRGYRSHGPTRARLYAGADYAANANDTVIAMPMIETGEALENLDAILSTPGIDAIYVGPADLGQSLGGKAQADHTDPKMLGIVEGIAASARKHGVVPGIHCASPAYALRMVAAGYQFVTIQSDAAILSGAVKGILAQMRDAAPAESAAGKSPY